MIAQVELFVPPPAARCRDPETSHAAARSMRRAADMHAHVILGALQAIGRGTYTDIAARSGLEPVQVNRRLPELRAVGLVRRLPQTAPTPSGRLAHVYEVA